MRSAGISKSSNARFDHLDAAKQGADYAHPRVSGGFVRYKDARPDHGRLIDCPSAQELLRCMSVGVYKAGHDDLPDPFSVLSGLYWRLILSAGPMAAIWFLVTAMLAFSRMVKSGCKTKQLVISKSQFVIKHIIG